MSEYLPGHQVITTLNIEAFELVEFAKKELLQPYTNHGKKVCDIEKKKEFKDQEGVRLLRLGLGTLNTGAVITGKKIFYNNSDLEIEKVQLEKEIKALNEKPCLPAEYKDCLWDVFDLPISQNAAEKIINRFKGYIYLKSDVEKLKRFEPDNDGVISKDKNIKWKDITISFLNEVEMHIQFKEDGNGKNVTRRFDHLGFGDGRQNNDVPIKAWELFLGAAKEQKIPHTFNNRSQIESTVKTIRQRLKQLFPNIEEDPVPHNKKDQSYHFPFKLNPPE